MSGVAFPGKELERERSGEHQGLLLSPQHFSLPSPTGVYFHVFVLLRQGLMLVLDLVCDQR